MGKTRAQQRALVYAGGRVPRMGNARTADSIATNGIHNAAIYQDARSGAGDYVGAWQYRPGQSDPNRVKHGSVISGDLWTHEQSLYTDARTDLAYEEVGYIHPDTLNECIRLAQRFIYFLDWMPLTPWTDGDFVSSSATSPYDWTAAASGTTVTKDSTGARSPSGKRSLVLTGAGYTRTSSLFPTPGDRLVHGADYSAEAGVTATYSLWDVTHGVTLFTDSHQAQAFRHVIHTDTIPAGCYEVKAQFQTSGGVSVFDTTFGHLSHARSLQVPSSVNEMWRLVSFGPAEYNRAIADSYAYSADSRLREAWRRPFDYDLNPVSEEANPYQLQIYRDEGLQEKDYWIYALRPYSDIDEVLDENGVSDAPENLLLASIYNQLAQVLVAAYPSDPRWPALLNASQAELDAQRTARKPAAPRMQPETYIPGGRRGGFQSPYNW